MIIIYVLVAFVFYVIGFLTPFLMVRMIRQYRERILNNIYQDILQGGDSYEYRNRDNKQIIQKSSKSWPTC